MSDFIKNAVETGVRRAADERNSARARDELRVGRLTGFKQTEHNTLQRMFDAANEEFRDRYGITFKVEKKQEEGRLQEVRFSHGREDTLSYFSASCNEAGEVIINCYVISNAVAAPQATFGDASASVFESAFGHWVERFVHHMERERNR